MKLLSIETSCDDTCISILEMHGSFSARGGSAFGGKVLANNTNSQIKTHMPYGGVYPALAKKEHIKNLPILFEASLKQLGHRMSKRTSDVPVDAIAVTYGPGLEMCLWTGIAFAKDLAKKWNVPLIPVNHMEGHVLSPFGKNKGKFEIPKVKLPMLSLLVSGGHTQLVLTKKWMRYEIIGESLDDAVGEAFDKVARMLDLPYPGGPQISALAEKEREKLSSRRYVAYGSLGRSDGDGQRKFSTENFRADRSNISSKLIKLPRPMLHSKNFDFSFSGLKTAVLYLIKKIGKLDPKTKAQIALEFENAAIECLVYKTQKAVEKYKIETLIVAGGVAANKHLRDEMKKITRAKAGQAGRNIKLLFPTKELSTDNSLMIGMAGYLNYIKNKKKTPKIDSVKATGNLRL